MRQGVARWVVVAMAAVVAVVIAVAPGRQDRAEVPAPGPAAGPTLGVTAHAAPATLAPSPTVSPVDGGELHNHDTMEEGTPWRPALDAFLAAYTATDSPSWRELVAATLVEGTRATVATMDPGLVQQQGPTSVELSYAVPGEAAVVVSFARGPRLAVLLTDANTPPGKWLVAEFSSLQQ